MGNFISLNTSMLPTILKDESQVRPLLTIFLNSLFQSAHNPYDLPNEQMLGYDGAPMDPFYPSPLPFTRQPVHMTHLLRHQLVLTAILLSSTITFTHSLVLKPWRIDTSSLMTFVKNYRSDPRRYT